MKKTLIALLALAGVAAAGTEETITLQPTPQTACTWQPEFSLEYLYAFADKKDEIDTQGVRASFSVIRKTDSPFSHQFSLNLSYREGEEKESIEDIYLNHKETDKAVTFGYDLNYAVTDKVTLFAGAKAGYAISEYEIDIIGIKLSDDMEGYTYSVGGGVKYQITESVNLKAGYEFSRTFFGDIGSGESRANIIVNQHIISVGVGYQF